MMDPNIGWFQPEHNGPALDLWRNIWNTSNTDTDLCSHPNHDANDSNNQNKYLLLNTISSNARNAKNRKENVSSTYDFDNNQHLCRIYNGTPWRRLRDFYDSGITGLHQEIEDFYDYMKPMPEERDMRKAVLERITNVIEDLWPHAIVDCFGSFRTGTYLPTSDIDLVVMGTWDTSPLLQLENRLLHLRVCDPSTLRVLDKATIPIIKMTDSLSGVRINISFNLKNVFKSVLLVKEFKEKFPNLVKLVLVIKHFVLQRDLNEVFTGGISSYAITLMVVNFFQLHQNIESNSPNANLGGLLLEFFQLYGQLINYEKVGLRIREGGSYVKKDLLIRNMEKCYRPSLLCIEDPLDPTNNVSRNSYGVEKVKNAFDYAYDILYRAVGPLNSTVDQTKSLLGRIIRVTDSVVENREKIKTLFSIDVKSSQHFNRSIRGSSDQLYVTTFGNRGRYNRKLNNDLSRFTPNRKRNHNQNHNYRYNHNQQNISTGDTSVNSNHKFQNYRSDNFRHRNHRHEDYVHYHNQNSHNHQYNGQYSGRSFGHPIRKQRSSAEMEADTTSEPISSSNSSSNNSTNGSNGDYEFISNEPIGSPIQIVKVTEDRKFELDIDALSSILLRDSIRDTPVVVVSIAGDFRKGKSFMLNFFLRYLQSGCGTIDWIGDGMTPLKGFSWRGGSERDTTGILMWSEPFIIKSEDGKDVAIVLMDTQGAFDSEYTVRDSATVFALSTMTSSIQVFNLMHNLQEDNLQVLEIFTEYGRLALEATDEKPFQKLVFLIRDWSFPYEHAYGLNGGQQLLEKKLAIKENQPSQLQRVRRHIRSCFSDINCFLMPHPGPKVATNPKFDGRLQDIDPEFIEHLQTLVPLMLDPKNVVVKEIGGRVVTGKQLMQYFRVYINVFQGETMPEPKSMLEATAEANNLTAVATVKDNYITAMEDVCGGDRPFMNPKSLENKHQDLRQEAIEDFDKIPKMGGKEFSESYREKLLIELDQAFEHFEAQNKSKNMFSLFGTPMVLLVACVICFISSRIFELIGFMPIANLFFLIGTIDLGLLVMYMFGRYSGNYPEFIVVIDQSAEKIWLFVLEMSFKVMQNAVENRTRTNNTTKSSRSPVSTPTTSSSSHPLSVSSSSSTLRRSQSTRHDL